jgi:enoyl-CoA hydratase
MQDKFVYLEIQGSKARLVINRPLALNALNHQILNEISDHCKQLAQNQSVQVVIVCSSGDKAFVAGADIKEMRDLNPQQAQGFSHFGQQVLAALENLPQIVIAQVQGFALGGGLELALACDFIVASENAKFGLPEVTLGLIPGFAGTQRLARRIGVSRAIEWISTAAKYSAQEAYSCGLLNHVVKPDELSSFVENLSDKIVENAPQAVRVAKQVVRQGMNTTAEVGSTLECANFGIRFSTVETSEGMAAFIEKRQPDFSKK